MFKIFIVMILAFSGCANLQNKTALKKKSEITTYKSNTYYKVLAPSKIKSSKIITQKVTQKASAYRRIKPSKKLKLKYSKKLYRFWIKYFTKREKSRFNRHLRNADKYREVVKKIFKSHGVPEDIFYLGLIESGYNTRIRSRASAVGPWQFIKATGRRYGLKINRKVDERYSIYKSTKAAARYLKDLYNIFGCWELAFVAYNKGENGIIRAIRRAKSRDYRVLVRRRLLPKETIYYIPKIVAARELYLNRKKYGLTPFLSSPRIFANYKKFRIKRNISLNSVAKKIKAPYSVLKMMNPDVKKKRISASTRRPFELYYPARYKNFSVKYFRKSFKNSSKPTYVNNRFANKTHLVKKGDNLTSVARKYNVSIRDIKKRNGLRSSLIKINTKLSIPTYKSKVYVVRKGDYLEQIAKKFGLSVRKLVSYNSLRSYKIYPRQRIHIPL